MKRVSNGFTLIEMMVTIAVAVILLAVAVPSFQETITSNRLSTSANDFVNSMRFARSEAIKLGNNVIVSALDSTDAANEWGKGGWQVTSGGTVIQQVAAMDSLTLNAAARTSFTYTPEGMVSAGHTDTLDLCSDSGEPGRQITVAQTGSVTVNRDYTCP